MESPTELDAAEARVAADPRYAALVHNRQRFSWVLTAVTVATYTGFISLIAFDKPFMARPVTAGAVTSVAVVLGMAVLLGTVAVCGLYVRRANGEYDARLAAILADARLTDAPA